MSEQALKSLTRGAIEQASSTETLSNLEERCRDCKPLSMLECIDGCRIWKIKNEFRKLQKKMQSPAFAKQLLNAIKNKRRLQILEILSEAQHTLLQLQSELKTLGYAHGLNTITEEYVLPLEEAGLIDEVPGKYHVTLLGVKIRGLLKECLDIADFLPTHSECHEEEVLSLLLEGPTTFKKISAVIPPKSVARVLSRLQASRLLDPPKSNYYVFFFKTQRNPRKEILSPTEKRVYENVPVEGISARELSDKSGISIRRTYKYLRHLKGKKLIFTREKPRTYTLTAKGRLIALKLSAIHKLLAEFRVTAEHLVNDQNDKVKTGAPLLQKTKVQKELNLIHKSRCD